MTNISSRQPTSAEMAAAQEALKTSQTLDTLSDICRSGGLSYREHEILRCGLTGLIYALPNAALLLSNLGIIGTTHTFSGGTEIDGTRVDYVSLLRPTEEILVEQEELNVLQRRQNSMLQVQFSKTEQELGALNYGSLVTEEAIKTTSIIEMILVHGHMYRELNGSFIYVGLSVGSAFEDDGYELYHVHVDESERGEKSQAYHNPEFDNDLTGTLVLSLRNPRANNPFVQLRWRYEALWADQVAWKRYDEREAVKNDLLSNLLKKKGS